MIHIGSIRHAYPEKNGIIIDRPNGRDDYTFLHFFNSVELKVGGEIITTKPGAVIIFDKSHPQYFCSGGDLVHDWFHFVGDPSEILSHAKIQLNTLYYPEKAAFITEICHEMESEYFGDFDNKKEILELKFKELILKLGRAMTGQGVAEFDIKTKSSLRTLRRKMFSSLDEKWTTQRMADEMGLSQSYFYNVYKSLYNISPMNDLINARISKAKNILIFENRSVAEISSLVGYDNVTHFTRQFKKYTQMTPLEYRKIRRK